MIIAFDPVLARAGRDGTSTRRAPKVLLIDNKDSFTAALADACRSAGAPVEVVPNTVDAQDAFAHALRHRATLLLSPGQGGPVEAGCCMDLIALAARRVPVLGICLGHQAIVAYHGGAVVRAHEPCHGQSSTVAHDGEGPFAALPSPMRVGRYHALCTPVNQLPDGLHLHAVLDRMAMAVSNIEEGQFGIQFHPESVLTPLGAGLFDAMLDWAEARHRDFAGLTAAAAHPKIAA